MTKQKNEEGLVVSFLQWHFKKSGKGSLPDGRYAPEFVKSHYEKAVKPKPTKGREPRK